MTFRLDISTLILYALLAVCCCNFGGTSIYAQEDSTATKKKEEGDAKKDLTTLQKILKFKNFFHHDDSSRLARRYIRWHKKLDRENRSYRFTVKADDIQDSLPYLRLNESEHLTKEVLGWYPYWEKDLHQHLDYSLLSTIVYFTYEVDPKTGKPVTIHDWETSPVVDTIVSNYPDKKILLNISNFGNGNNKEFLNNAKAGDTLINRVLKLLENCGAHGVCIDFEGIQKSQRDNYNSFIALFSQRLKKQDENYQLYLTVPAVDWNKYLNYDVLIPAVDRFIIMGYNYYGSTSKVAGPIAPLKSGKQWDPFNLTNSVDYYLANKIPADKIILALPFYGSIWNTRSGKIGAKVDKFIGSRTYDYIKKCMDSVPEIEQQYDAVSQSAYYSFILNNGPKKNKRQFRQIWFESDKSLTSKLALIEDKKIGGLGIWALGYNQIYDNYWQVVKDAFTKREGPYPSPVILNYPDKIVIIIADTTKQGVEEVICDGCKPQSVSPTQSPEGPPGFWAKITDISALFEKIKDYQAILLMVLSFVVLFGGAGLLISMFRSGTRMYFFSSRAYTIYYTGIVLIFTIMLMRWKNVINDSSIALITGFLVGAVAIYFVSGFIQKIKRELP